MRITKDRLVRLSESYIAKYAKNDRSIMCVYMDGSLLSDEPFIDGTTDVDLTIVHDRHIETAREIVAIAPDASFDLLHIGRDKFENTRALRTDPWLGSSLCFDPVVLLGKGHWFEFVLASVEASFFLP